MTMAKRKNAEAAEPQEDEPSAIVEDDDEEWKTGPRRRHVRHATYKRKHVRHSQ